MIGFVFRLLMRCEVMALLGVCLHKRQNARPGICRSVRVISGAAIKEAVRRALIDYNRMLLASLVQPLIKQLDVLNWNALVSATEQPQATPSETSLSSARSQAQFVAVPGGCEHKTSKRRPGSAGVSSTVSVLGGGGRKVNWLRRKPRPAYVVRMCVLRL